MALPCASVKRSRVLPEVFEDCSSVSRRLSPRERTIIREVNDTAYSLNFLERGGIGRSESCEKSGVLHLVHRHLHSIVPTL